MGANHRIDTITDLARHRLPMEVVCACGHRATLNPWQVFMLCVRRGWRTNTIEAVRQRLRCSKCGARPERIGPRAR